MEIIHVLTPLQTWLCEKIYLPLFLYTWLGSQVLVLADSGYLPVHGSSVTFLMRSCILETTQSI